MSTVDLDRYRFDFDLTFSVLFMNADGRIYHRYGSRDHRSSDARLNFESFDRVAATALEAHRAHGTERTGAPSSSGDEPSAKRKKRTIWDYEPFAKRASRDRCIHCHSIFPAKREVEQAAGTWAPDQIWVYPDPKRIGIELSPVEPRRVIRVFSDSPAAVIGLRRGDVLRKLGGVAVASVADVQAVLDSIPYSGGRLSLEYQRSAERKVGPSETVPSPPLRLPEGWRRASPLEFSWRPSKWTLTPQPGFGGKFLTAEERSAKGIESPLGYVVTYIVNWGPRAHVGRAVIKAGLRKGDIVTSINDRTDFASPDHVHAWVRLSCRVGEELRLKIWRDGAPREIRYDLP